MNWSLLNITWTTITLIGTFASMRVFWLSLGDYRLVKQNPRNAPLEEYREKLIVSEMALLGEFSRFFIQAFFLMLGILVITTPPPSRILNDSIIGLFIIGAIILMASSLEANRVRKRLVG